jgi:LSD1 subclass zinc finger protein
MVDSISCPHCRRLLQMPADYGGGEVRCPVCAQVFVGGAQTNVTAQAPQPTAPPVLLEVREHIADAPRPLGRRRQEIVDDEDDQDERDASTHRFRPAAGLGLAVKILLALNALLGLVMIGNDYLDYRLATRLIALDNVPQADIDSNDLRQSAFAVVNFLTYLATVIVFVIWFYRAHANLKSLDARHLRYTSGWAVGYWFIPIMNLFRPVQVAQEIWRTAIHGPWRAGRFTSRGQRIPGSSAGGGRCGSSPTYSATSLPAWR